MHLLIIICILLMSFLAEAGLVWVLCWGLRAIGISTIFGLPVVFSWPLVIVIWILSFIIRGAFSGRSQ